MNNITSEGLSLLLSTGPLSYITDKKVPVNFSKRDLPQECKLQRQKEEEGFYFFRSHLVYYYSYYINCTKKK